MNGRRRKTVGVDKGYDVDNFVTPCRALNITAHVASRQKGTRVDGRTLRHAGYALSQCIRKRIEEPFGWGKLIGTLRQAKVRGRDKVNDLLHWNLIGWNLVRLRALVAETG